jgi:hypothetical protein
MAVIRDIQWSVAPHVFNVIVVFSSLGTKFLSFRMHRQKVPDNPEIYRSLENCGSTSPFRWLDFWKMYPAAVYRATFLYNDCTGLQCLSSELYVYSVWPLVYRVVLLWLPCFCVLRCAMFWTHGAVSSGLWGPTGHWDCRLDEHDRRVTVVLFMLLSILNLLHKTQLLAHTKHMYMWYFLQRVSTVDRTSIFSESNLKLTHSLKLIKHVKHCITWYSDCFYSNIYWYILFYKP